MQTRAIGDAAKAEKGWKTHIVIPAQAGIQERSNPVFGLKKLDLGFIAKENFTVLLKTPSFLIFTPKTPKKFSYTLP